MRIVHVCGELGFYGAENVVTQLVRNTDEPDLEVSVMTVNRWEHPEARASIDFPLVAIDRRGWGDAGFLGRMVGTLRGMRADLVHTHAHHGRYWGRLAAALAGVPAIVHTEHNPSLTPPRPRFVYDALNRALAGRTVFVDFNEERRRRLTDFERVPLERVAVIPNGVDTIERDAGARERARAELGVGPGEIAVTVAARLFPQKRLDLAIDALAALPEAERSRVKLVLIGDGPLRGELERQAGLRGVADRVRFFGFRLDARSLLPGADLALLSSAREAMPLAIIEAMLERAPVVSTPWDGAQALLGEGRFGRIADAFTAEALAAALRAALADPAETRRRAAAAFEHARLEFDVTTQARRYAALYREVSAGTRAASPAITTARS